MIFLQSGSKINDEFGLVLGTGYFNETGELYDFIPKPHLWQFNEIVDLTKIPIIHHSEQSRKIRNRNKNQ